MIEILTQFVTKFPLIYNLIIILISFALLAKASSLLVLGISNYAKKLGISDYLIGLVIVAAAASTPEFLAALSGVLYTSPGIVFGTIFGSNFAGITLGIGILAIMGKKMSVTEQAFEKTKWDVIALIALPFILLLDGQLNTLDGAVLILAFIFYLIVLWKREGEFGQLKKGVAFKEIYKDGLIFTLSLVTVLIASRFLVQSSLQVSQILNLPDFIIASFVIGIGAQVPDLALGLHSIRKGHNAVALGDVIGSTIIKSLLFLGVFAMMINLQFNLFDNLIMGIVTILTCMLLFWLVRKGEMTRTHGIILSAIYLLFTAVQFLYFR